MLSFTEHRDIKDIIDIVEAEEEQEQPSLILDYAGTPEDKKSVELQVYNFYVGGDQKIKDNISQKELKSVNDVLKALRQPDITWIFQKDPKKEVTFTVENGSQKKEEMIHSIIIAKNNKIDLEAVESDNEKAIDNHKALVDRVQKYGAKTVVRDIRGDEADIDDETGEDSEKIDDGLTASKLEKPKYRIMQRGGFVDSHLKTVKEKEDFIFQVYFMQKGINIPRDKQDFDISRSEYDKMRSSMQKYMTDNYTWVVYYNENPQKARTFALSDENYFREFYTAACMILDNGMVANYLQDLPVIGSKVRQFAGGEKGEKFSPGQKEVNTQKSVQAMLGMVERNAKHDGSSEGKEAVQRWRQELSSTKTKFWLTTFVLTAGNAARKFINWLRTG